MPLVFLIVLLAQSVYELDEVVVTATRYPVALKDVALATAVIDKKDIDRVPSAKLAEVIQAYAGIDIKDYGTSGSLSSLLIRGIQSNGILVLVNGHPLNSITTGTADLSLVSSTTVERIEIVKGPVSSLYGANALGGVINIITTKQYRLPEYRLTFTPSSTNWREPFQTRELSISMGVPVKATMLECSGAWKASRGVRTNSDYQDYHLQGNVVHTTRALTLSAEITSSDKEYGVPGPAMSDSSAPSLDREHDRIILADVVAKWQATELLKLEQRLYADRKVITYNTRSIGWDGDTLQHTYDYLTHSFGFNTIALLPYSSHELIIGIDGHYDSLETHEVYLSETTWTAASYNVGAWLGMKRKITPAVAITSNIRVDHNSEFGNFLSPHCGMISTVMPRLWLKLSLGKAFRAPTFNDLYWPLSGNPDLKPEHGWAYEARFETAPFSNTFVALSLFRRTVRDRIFWLPKENMMWQPQNVNHVSIQGLDCEMRVSFNDQTELSWSATLLRARQQNQEIVYEDWLGDTAAFAEIERIAAFTPQAVLSAHVSAPFLFGSLLHLTGLYTSEQYNYYPDYDNYPDIGMNTKTLDDYFVLHASMNRRLSQYIDVSIGAKNVFNTHYATQFGYTMDDLDYPMPGRTFFAQLVVQR